MAKYTVTVPRIWTVYASSPGAAIAEVRQMFERGVSAYLSARNEDRRLITTESLPGYFQLHNGPRPDNIEPFEQAIRLDQSRGFEV